nr:hypothetical protein [Mycolicibacter terrae]
MAAMVVLPVSVAMVVLVPTVMRSLSMVVTVGVVVTPVLPVPVVLVVLVVGLPVVGCGGDRWWWWCRW